MRIYIRNPENVPTNKPVAMRIVFGKEELILSNSLTNRGLFKW